MARKGTASEIARFRGEFAPESVQYGVLGVRLHRLRCASLAPVIDRLGHGLDLELDRLAAPGELLLRETCEGGQRVPEPVALVEDGGLRFCDVAGVFPFTAR